jgi:hypothetical protein
MLGVSEADIEHADLHPFVVAALEGWLHLGKREWLVLRKSPRRERMSVLDIPLPTERGRG